MRRVLSSAAVALVLGSVVACGSAGSSEAVDESRSDLYGLGSLGGTWPGGVVPVCFPDLTNNAALRAKIPTILAMSWSTAANITFTGFGACHGGNEVQIVFASGTRGFTDSLGVGARTVTLISDDTTPNQAHFQYEVIHEMGHALGFAHEMQRPDNWPNGVALQCPGNDYDHLPRSGGVYLTASYDSNSIMNYCDPNANQTTALSAGDIAGVSRSDAYGLPFLAASPNAITVTQNGAGVDVTFLTQNSWAGPQGINGEVTPISVSVTGLPAGVEAVPLDTYGTRVNIEAFANAPVGTSYATIIGRGADAQGNVLTRTALLQIDVLAAAVTPPPQAPKCSLTSTCDAQYVPPANGVTGHYQTAETITGTCATTATTMQQFVNGQWVTVPDFIGNLSYSSATPDKFQVGVQSDTGQTTSGAPVGSVQTVRACVSNAGGLACDAASAITIVDCCTPMTCNDTMCGTQSDGCGGTITCTAGCGKTCTPQKCPVGQTWNSKSCDCEVKCTTARQCCILNGGDWNGKTCS